MTESYGPQPPSYPYGGQQPTYPDGRPSGYVPPQAPQPYGMPQPAFPIPQAPVPYPVPQHPAPGSYSPAEQPVRGPGQPGTPLPYAPSPASPPLAGKVEERAHPLTPLVRGWVAVVTIGWVLLQDRLQYRHDGTDRLPWWVLVAVIAGVAVLGLIAGFISWRFTKFIADENELRVESGWISRRSRRISYTRLQSVDVMQPLAPRLLGLAEVRIDAGAHDSTKLRYLSRRRAYELRDFLMLRAHGAQVSVDAAKAQTSDPLFVDVGRSDRVIVTVQPHELLLGALVSHDLLSLLLGFAVPIGVAWAITSYVGGTPVEALPVFVLAGGVPLVISIGQYFARRVMAQFNFTLAETQAGLRITRGLTNLTSQTVPVRRIQSIRVLQPLFWRPMGRYRVDLEVLGLGEATHNESTSKVSTLLLPIGSRAQVDAALAAVWPGLRLDEIRYVPSPPKAKLLDPLAYSWNAYGLDADVVVTRRGWLNRVQSIVPHARLQSVGAHQGPFERLLGLANVTFHTTGLLHTHAVIHMDADHARGLVYAEADRAMTSRDAELTVPSVQGEANAVQGDAHAVGAEWHPQP